MQHVATKQMEKTQKHGSTLFICLTWEATEVAGLLEESEATTASSKTLRIGGRGTDMSHMSHMSRNFSWRVLCKTLPQALQLVHSILSFSTHVARRTEGNAVTSKNEISGTKPKIQNGIDKR